MQKEIILTTRLLIITYSTPDSGNRKMQIETIERHKYMKQIKKNLQHPDMNRFYQSVSEKFELRFFLNGFQIVF